MKFKAILLACALGSGAYAQDPALLEAATAYVEHPVQQNVIDKLFSPASIMAQLESVTGDIPDAQRATVAQIISEEMNAVRPELEASMIRAAAENFTMEEITALNAFYATGPGASAMTKMQSYMQSAMRPMGPVLQKAQENLFRRLQTELSK